MIRCIILQLYSSAEGLYFTLRGQIYLPGDTVLITDIGIFINSNQAGDALVCDY